MALQSRIRNVTAVLGPTNTGKTHLAIERMLGHQSGMIGLPLRLLAREVYDKIVTKVGAQNVALITGEEKIKPENPRFWVSTVEAMPREIETDFLAIDEVQLCADPERGHVFTDRLLNARGREETLLLGAGTMREAINDLVPGANFISRPRLSKITYAGQKKITRLPKRTAIVAFSAAEVYEIAELIKRQLGGAAVVLGALSPRTRNAQVALYQSGDVDYLVATDAIGMGLNLDVDHVAFAGVRKFDGQTHRNLNASELAQVAGRAGRHMNDGTFGVTGDAEPLDADMIERLENHTFDQVRTLQWRNSKLDFATLERLRESLRETPGHIRLQRARMADDVLALETLSADNDIAAQARSKADVERLWEVCQVPDYRKISSQNHAELVATLFGFLMSDKRRIPEDWFTKQVELADRTDGDIDTLSTRLAHIRTWTFVANRSDWLADHAHWQGRTRAVEDSLSDALHEQLAQRFVDAKTSALMKGLRDKEEMSADISADGAVHVEKHFVGRLKGFRFQPDTQADAQGVHGKASRGAAAHVLAGEFAMRARRVSSAKSDAFKLTRQARVMWRDEEIARLEAGEDPLKPSVILLCDEHLSGPDKEKVQTRLDTWIAEIIGERLKPLVELKNAEDVTGLARGIAFRLVENFGALKRETIAEDMRQLDQPSRGQLRKYGVRFGAFNIFLPPLLKPAPAELILSLWSLKNAVAAGLDPEHLPEPPRPGLTSAAANPAIPEAFYRAAGYHLCGPRAVRMDMLERLADQIRPLLAWRKTEIGQTPPRGSSGDGGFIVTPEMMSVLGCSQEEFGNVLKALGFRLDRRPAPPKVVEVAQPASVAADAVPAATEAASATTSEVADVSNGALDGALPEVEGAAEPPAPSVPVPVAAVELAPVATETVAPATVETAPAVVDTAVAAVEPVSAPVSPIPTSPDAENVAAPDAPQATADGTKAEPEMIDIWRPRRRDRHERPQHGARPGTRNGTAEAGQDREGRGERRPRGGRNRGDRRPGRDSVPAPQAEAGTTAGAMAASDAVALTSATLGAEPVPSTGENQQPRRDGDRNRNHRVPRGDRPRNDGVRNDKPRDGKPGEVRTGEPRAGDARTGDGKPRENNFRGGNRGPGGGGDRGGERVGDRRDDRRRRDERGGGPRVTQHSASPQRKGADPDSPFAALSALKLQLEKQAKERS